MGKRSYLTASDLGMDREAIKRSFAQHVEYSLGKDEFSATQRDFFKSIALSVRDRMFDRWNQTQQGYYRRDERRVYYLSVEYLVGRLLSDSLQSLGVYENAKAALQELDLDIEELCEIEDEPGLGNGGLGRLAACFLDSLATLGIPAIGYGIRYEYGIFRQEIVDGAQVEQPDNWLRYGTPWEISRPERLFVVRFGGRVESGKEDGRVAFHWVDTDNIVAIANDIPVPGYQNDVVNTLRLWSAHASRELDISSFNRGDYIRAVEQKNSSENLTRVLYPNDQVAAGSELRLKQEYFFVSATLQDALRRHLNGHPSLGDLADKAVFQLNDTHPAVAVAEMMRLLVDEHGLEWEKAWAITTRCFAYTNHTVMPEALETWPVALFERVLPRHMQLVYEINRRFLDEVRSRFPDDSDRVRRMSIIDDGPPKKVRMAHLAIVGSFAVNGVSELHSRLLSERLFRDFADLAPAKFHNETNGITPRRWLRKCNPALSELITSAIGDRWLTNLDELERLAPLVHDVEFQRRWHEVKQANKRRLAAHLQSHYAIAVDTDSLFDVQVKRMHEYKRQLLNVLHVIAMYQQLKSGLAVGGRVPRTVFFAGKAAPGYEMAKQVIRLIHDVGRVIGDDPATRDRLKVVFVPNYSVSVAEILIPAADLSEQISTAGMEASGTGNMKLALNGALTIGTLDGANVEIGDAVGKDNLFIFGLTEPDVRAWKSRGYDPHEPYGADPALRAVLDALLGGAFSYGDAGRYRAIGESLLNHGDPYFVLADFRSYHEAQLEVDACYADRDAWTRKSILNVARMGRFSSDATIRRYARDIWRVPVRSPSPPAPR
jgi:starch phosphorylase